MASDKRRAGVTRITHHARPHMSSQTGSRCVCPFYLSAVQEISAHAPARRRIAGIGVAVAGLLRNEINTYVKPEVFLIRSTGYICRNISAVQ